MNAESILRVLVLLTVANGTPVIVARLFGQAARWPVDFNRTFFDGSPIFGPSKTIPGVVAGIVAATYAAAALGLPWRLGAMVAAACMAGDLFSSFVKRRLRMKPSTRATGLDQIPESLFGALAARLALPLTMLDVAIATLAFFLGQLVLSRLSYAIGLRREPY